MLTPVGAQRENSWEKAKITTHTASAMRRKTRDEAGVRNLLIVSRSTTHKIHVMLKNSMLDTVGILVVGY